MDQRRLQSFVALAEALNFRRAADRVHLTQSALWKHVKHLEDELGVPLFSRQGRHISLLDTGIAFLADARSLLQDMQRAKERALRTGRGHVGVVRLGISSGASVQPHPLTVSTIRTFRATYPGVELDIKSNNANHLVAALQEGRLDGAFVLREAGKVPGVSYVDIDSRREVVLVMSKNHRLAKRRTIRIVDLKGEELIWYPREQKPSFYDELLMACHSKGGFSPSIAQTVEDGHLAHSLVAANMGVTPLPILWIGAYGGNVGMISIKRISDFSVESHLSYAHRTADKSGPSARFLEVFKTVLGAQKRV